MKSLGSDRRMTVFQDELGTRQDRVVARDALTELLDGASARYDPTARVFEAVRNRLTRD